MEKGGAGRSFFAEALDWLIVLEAKRARCWLVCVGCRYDHEHLRHHCNVLFLLVISSAYTLMSLTEVERSTQIERQWLATLLFELVQLANLRA